MTDISKYDGTSNLMEHISAYTIDINENDLLPDEIKFVMLKKLGQTIINTTLPTQSIDSFTMLVDAFVKAHAEYCVAIAFTYDMNPHYSNASKKLKESLR
ncbi:hypothetical protein HAX54_050486 [Datura stramonium]|uniref:Uncharacterized protein n=1 Tax=Datura stramonium TaxID=4076 RepID=A0ABS8WNR5_DATST|nr:hypothetical protein [Datura stramonium]